MNLIKNYTKKLKIIWSQPSEGFGDTFAKITKTFGMTPCDKCNKRRKAWNRKIRYAKIKNYLKKKLRFFFPK